MVHSKLLMTTSAALFAFATTASAVTLEGNADNTNFDLSLMDNFVGSVNISAGEDITYTFDVLDDLTIRQFAVSGSGFDAGADLMNVRYGYGQTAGDVVDRQYDQIFEYRTVASAVGSVTGQSFEAGETFFFTFLNTGDPSDPANETEGTTVSFDVAPISVPAAGFLLLGALGAGALVGRRKKAF